MLQRSSGSEDYKFVSKSNTGKKRASKSKPAVFPWRTWTAPEALLPSDFRVLVEPVYFKKGSKWRKRGKVRGEMEVYRHAHPAAPPFLVGKHGDGGECFYNFWTWLYRLVA